MRNLNRGFTLLEVMVALAIFAVSALVLIKQSSRSAHQEAQLESKLLANWVAENTLAELRVKGSFPALGDSEKSKSFARRDWDVQVNVTKTSNQFLRRVEVAVSVKEMDAPNIRLTGFLGKY